MTHWAKKRDGNENEIVDLLRAYGYSVELLFRVGGGVPDLLVGGEMPCPYCGHHFKQNKLVEVKTADGKLDERQEKWHGEWKGQVDIARQQEDCERIIGREPKTVIRIGGRRAGLSAETERRRTAEARKVHRG